MTRNRLSKARRLAAALVLGNLAVIGLLASVLPQAALALLPLLAIALPLLSAALVEESLKRAPSDRDLRKLTKVRSIAPRFPRPLHHAA